MATPEVVPVYRETETPADVAAQVAALRILLAVAARRDEARGVQE
jgi:hypothetical protein